MAKIHKCRLLFSRRIETIVEYPDGTKVNQVIKAGATAEVGLGKEENEFTLVRFDCGGNKGQSWFDFETDGITKIMEGDKACNQ